MHALSKSQLSDLSALEFALQCIKRGAQVAFPFGEHSLYNVVVDYDGSIYRVRAKIAGVEKLTGTLMVNAHKRTPNNSGAGPSSVTSPYTTQDIDVLAGCYHGIWYLFPEPVTLPANIKMRAGSQSLTAGLQRHKEDWAVLGLAEQEA